MGNWDSILVEWSVLWWVVGVASYCFIAQDNAGEWETGTLSWWNGVSSDGWWEWPLIALLLRIMLEDGKLGLYPGGTECPPVGGGRGL